MKLIVVSGVDGSGKTSVIELLQKKLKEQGYETRYVWLRYNHFITKFVLAFCRYTGFTRYLHFENSRVVYHDFYRSKVISILFVTTTFIDTFFASMVKIYLPMLWSKKIIICDRWIYDIMIDLEVDTRLDFSTGSRLKSIFMKLLPASAQCFLVSRNIDLVRNERDESMNDSNFPRRCEFYQQHSLDDTLTVVDNNGTIEQSVEQICRAVDLDIK